MTTSYTSTPPCRPHAFQTRRFAPVLNRNTSPAPRLPSRWCGKLSEIKPETQHVGYSHNGQFALQLRSMPG